MRALRFICLIPWIFVKESFGIEIATTMVGNGEDRFVGTINEGGLKVLLYHEELKDRNRSKIDFGGKKLHFLSPVVINERILNTNRVKYVEDRRTMEIEACSDKYKSVGFKADVLDIEDPMHCGLRFFQETYFKAQVAGGISKNCTYLGAMNYG
ncbi:hypothetical protein QAD02_016778 [Eretmocerus hayati]|uniref:Uncharacterized protein n=1 Tax=Eretmocerus hayati TaxID=131215 RepID=A0ACC2PC02_9HYME|nr:hypothetical protein QAD02_016778 [Eretmocerus hayati]